MFAVCFGGGTNSTAMLLRMKREGLKPFCILFADTGGEAPHTYRHLEVMQQWCKSVDFPDIITLKNKGVSLEQDCLDRNALPSVAYGFKTCSQRWKIRPQEKWFNNNPEVKALWDSGKRLTKAIGFDADEPHRAVDYQSDKYKNWYPLVEWEMGREECINEIQREGLELPGKSSCFFCPNMRQGEIRRLAAQYPDLANRAVAMEQNAELTHINGLGRNWSWESLLATDDMFPETYREQCDSCYDG